MVNSCVVWGCTNRAGVGDPGRRFFDIPKIIRHQGSETEQLSADRRNQWMVRINREGFNPDPEKRHNKVCSDHFITGKKADLYDRTNPDWAPSLLLGPKPKLSEPISAKKRFERVKGRHSKKLQYSAAQALLDLHQDQPHDEPPDDYESDQKVIPFFIKGPLEKSKISPVIPIDDVEILPKIRTELQRLTTENMELKEEIQCSKFSPESLKNEEEKVKHYTGLSFYILMALFNFVEHSITETSKTSLTKFEKLILVLMKLRLNTSLQDLGYRFKISTSCVSKVFLDVVHILYVRLKCLILWPEREELRMSMPMEFRKHFGLKVSIIIDCFEIFIERPSNLLARAETWSNYKHHNTVKYLIGITPQGAVSFISKGWGGRVSDKHVTENCGMLGKLLPGDIVLADRGFDIRESVGLYCAEVKIPAFTRGKKQLSPLEIEATRKIAHTRIHVERVIGLVRNKYTILQSTIPIDYLHSRADCVPTIDKITTICCALSNMCPSVVPFD